MATNHFAAHCATCGEPVAAGEGTVRTEFGGRVVTHDHCAPPERHARSFTVRRIDHDVETLLASAAANDGHDRRTARVLGLAAAGALALVAVVGVAAMRGDTPGGGSTSPGPPTTTSVRTDVAGVVEVRGTEPPDSSTTATPVVTVAVAAPEATVATTSPPPEVAPEPTAAPTPPPTQPPLTDPPPTAPPITEPPTTVTEPPTTVAAPPTTVPPPTTTRRRGKP